MGGELKKVKITNPLYLGTIAPFISDFLKKVRLAGVTYETLYTYFASTAQHGAVSIDQKVRDKAEFWVVFENDQPIAFAHWFVRPLPSIATVFCDFVYSWQRKKDPANLLFDEFKRFGEDHRAQIWEADATNRAVFEVLKRSGERRGMDVVESGRINFMMIRRS